MNSHTIWLLTTDQREHIEVYTEPITGDEVPIGTRVRISDPIMKWCYGQTGTIEAYHQSPRGFLGWHWVRFDGPEYANLATRELPKVHRSKFEVID